MNVLTKNLLGFVLSLGLAMTGMAQGEWNWGDNVDKAKEKNALYSDMVRAKNWLGAIEPHSWLLENTPDLNASIYINGAKIYEALADDAKDKTKELEYQDKAMEMYDLRIKYFGEEADVLNRKALKAYKYYKGTQSRYQELYELFDRAFELNGADLYSNNLTAYMDVIRRYKAVGGDIADDDVFGKYTAIIDAIEKQRAQGGDVDRLDKVKEYVDKILTMTVDVDCNFIVERLGPKYEETKDVNLAKKIFGLMVSQKCTDDPLAIKVAEAVNAESPDYGIAKFIAARAAADGDMDKAREYYSKAVDLTDSQEKKAEVLLSLARTQYSKGQKSAARTSAKKALAANPASSEAYEFIGDLYLASFDDCKGGESRVKDRAVFIAAYDMYQKGGATDKMAVARAQFPSIDEIFNEGKEEGQSISVDCWINETVKIQRRPAN